MHCAWFMHETTQHIYRKNNIRSCNNQIDQSPNKMLTTKELGKGYNPHLQVKDASVVPLEKVNDGHQVVHHLSKCPKHIFFDIRISHQMTMLCRYPKKYVMVPKALMQNFYARKPLTLLIFVESLPPTIMSFT